MLYLGSPESRVRFLGTTLFSHATRDDVFKFSSIEYQFRLNRLMSLSTNGLVEFEDYEIDRAQWQLSWRHEPLLLNRKTFDLLLYLVDHADRVVEKEELLRTLWPQAFVEESNLTQHIFLLRKALSRHGSGTKIIETVPGRGYRFAAVIKGEQPAMDRVVIRASESITRITLEEKLETSEPTFSGLEVARPLLSPPPKKRRIEWIAGGSVVAVALCVAGWFGWQRWLDRSGGPPVRVVLTAPDGTTGDPVLDHTLTEALRMDLAQSPYVTVLSAANVRATLGQMLHKPNDAITAAMAREICERTDSQAVLHGSIARNGQHYFITEDASNCVDGKILAEAQHEASRAEDLPHSIDILAESLRHKLGESRRSIARFNTPLFVGSDTVSLEAIKAYSQGAEALARGDIAKAVTLFKASIAADPTFAVAQYGLGATYATAGDDASARAAYAEAYRLKDTTTQPLQFEITATYIATNTQDLYESLRNDQSWAALYPNSPSAWNHLAGIQRELAQYPDAVRSSQQGISAASPDVVGRINLATGQIQAGDFSAARAILAEALAQRPDDDWVRTRVLELAYVSHDTNLLQAQRAWLAAHPNAATVTLGEAQIALAEGRFADGRRLAARSDELFHQQGVGGAGDRFIKNVGVILILDGDVDEGQRLFRSVPVDPEEGQELIGLVYVGDIAGAKSGLHAMLTKYPKGTLWNLYWGPQIRSAIAMAEHKPKEAAAILEESRPVEMRELAIPWMRGNAYLAAGQPALAEKDFRQVVTHPECDPTSSEISLSWLGLGRALAAENNQPDAIDAYRHFLTVWGHADSEAMYLKQAKQELATLQRTVSN